MILIHDNILSLIQNIDGPSSNSYVFFAKYLPLQSHFSRSPLFSLRPPFSIPRSPVSSSLIPKRLHRVPPRRPPALPAYRQQGNHQGNQACQGKNPPAQIGLCKWSAGLKVMNFQNRTEPIRLFIFSFFPSIVKNELAVLQQRKAVGLPAETRITFTFCYRKFFVLYHFHQDLLV